MIENGSTTVARSQECSKTQGRIGMAERVGFEPTVRFPVRSLSRRVLSTLSHLSAPCTAASLTERSECGQLHVAPWEPKRKAQPRIRAGIAPACFHAERLRSAP